MESLKDTITNARANRKAVGHFNIGDFTMLQGIFDAALSLEVPVIVGFSEGERAFLGVPQCAALVKSLRDEFSFPIYLNADHTHSIDSALEVARAGFDSIVFDLSALPFEENIAETKRAVEVLRGVNPNIFIEGEIGDIGTGSQIHAEMASKGPLTEPQDAKRFVEETGVDALAPAVGNMHGMSQQMVQGTAKKRLDIGLIREISKSTPSLLTLHGGSGTDDADFRDAIDAGIAVVHINTEVRVAWKNSLLTALKSSDDVVPYKVLPPVVEAVKNLALSRLRLFNGVSQQKSESGQGA